MPDGGKWLGRASEWDGVGVPLCQVPERWGQGEAANDSSVAGSRSRALVCVSSSTLSSLFSLCLTVCEKYVPCGLVGAVKWRLSVWLLVEAAEGEEQRVRKDSFSLIVFMAHAQLSPGDSLSDSTKEVSSVCDLLTL